MKTAPHDLPPTRSFWNCVLLRPALAGLLLLALAGCASPAKDAANTKSPEKQEEYVYYTPTGSSIPVRVRKSDLQAGTADTAHDQETLRKVQQRTNRTPQQAGGN